MKGSDTARGSMMMALFVLGHATGFLCGRRLNGFFLNAYVGESSLPDLEEARNGG